MKSCFIAAIVISIFISCRPDETIQPKATCADGCVDGRMRTKPFSSVSFSSPDWYLIDSAFIQDKTLTIDLFYSGGCKDHCLELIWRGEVLELSDSTSATYFAVSHCAMGDSCDELEKDNMVNDISFLDALDTTGNISVFVENFYAVDCCYKVLYNH